MAIVIGFEKIARSPKLHPTEVIGYWLMLPDQGMGPILQIDTLASGVQTGSQHHPRQTLQFTQNSARQLFQILKAEFKF
jgi:hypothetical protein